MAGHGRLGRMVRNMLRAAGVEVTRTAARQQSNRLRRFVRSGAVPWSPGYREAKERFIAGVLANDALLEVFRTGRELPPAYGVGFDERCVEYPWLFSTLGDAPGDLLDAGSVLNHAYVLQQARFQKRRLHILTLAPESECFWREGISYLFADLRDIPVRDDYYTNIACISTLEHVGCDNSQLSGMEVHRESRLEDYTLVMRELNRTLKPGGTLLVTVPFGVRRNYRGFQQFDSAMLARAIDAFGSASVVDTRFFRYTRDGWNVSSEADCANSEFAAWILEVWSGELTFDDVVVDPDRAAAARAVVCLRLVKA